MNAIETSLCIFELIIDDIRKNYTLTGGGGLSSIDQKTTTTFTASISQEQRRDLLTYEINIAEDGSVSIADKTVSTK